MAASRVAEGSGPAHESGMEGSMLASLPHELVKLVLDHLEPNDMLALEYTCRAGRGLTAGCWKDRCLEEYKDYTPSDWDQSSWKALLLNVYIPWGRLIGLWQANSQPYGGLVVVVA